MAKNKKGKKNNKMANKTTSTKPGEAIAVEVTTSPAVATDLSVMQDVAPISKPCIIEPTERSESARKKSPDGRPPLGKRPASSEKSSPIPARNPSPVSAGPGETSAVKKTPVSFAAAAAVPCPPVSPAEAANDRGDVLCPATATAVKNAVNEKKPDSFEHQNKMTPNKGNFNKNNSKYQKNSRYDNRVPKTHNHNQGASDHQQNGNHKAGMGPHGPSSSTAVRRESLEHKNVQSSPSNPGLFSDAPSSAQHAVVEVAVENVQSVPKKTATATINNPQPESRISENGVVRSKQSGSPSSAPQKRHSKRDNAPVKHQNEIAPGRTAEDDLKSPPGVAAEQQEAQINDAPSASSLNYVASQAATTATVEKMVIAEKLDNAEQKDANEKEKEKGTAETKNAGGKTPTNENKEKEKPVIVKVSGGDARNDFFDNDAEKPAHNKVKETIEKKNSKDIDEIPKKHVTSSNEDEHPKKALAPQETTKSEEKINNKADTEKHTTTNNNNNTARGPASTHSAVVGLEKDQPKKKVTPKPQWASVKHPLEFVWTLWQHDPHQSWESSLNPVLDVAYIEDMWSMLNFLKEPSDPSLRINYNFFRRGIKPEWEHPDNARGGRWCLTSLVAPSVADRVWLELVLLLAGGAELNDLSKMVNGVALVKKNNGFTVSIWLNTSHELSVKGIGQIIYDTLYSQTGSAHAMEFLMNKQGRRPAIFKLPKAPGVLSSPIFRH